MQSLRYYEFLILLTTILKLKKTMQVSANVNIDFQFPPAVSFPKIYKFANLHKF